MEAKFVKLRAGKLQQARHRVAKSALTYGVEIEVHDMSQRRAAQVVAEAIGNHPEHGTGRDDYGRPNWSTELPDGRRWTVVLDGSLGDYESSCEVVSPVMRFARSEDMEMVQTVVRALRKAGATVDSDCGLHVHVGAVNMGEALRSANLSDETDAALAARIARVATSVETTVCAAVAVHDSRERWCRRFPVGQATALRRVETRYDLMRASPGDRHYGVNLHAFAEHGTVEFRWFNGTLHAGTLRAAITLCCSLALKAAAATTVVAPRVEDNEQGMCRVLTWLRIKDKAACGHLLSQWVDMGAAADREEVAR